MSFAKLNDRLLLKNGKIFDPESNKTISGSLLIENGKITQIGKVTVKGKVDEIDCSGYFITTGFTDIHAHFREPGREDKETLETGARAAMAGGFTEVCVMPNTTPVLDTPESIRFILEKSAVLPISIHPIGAITTGQKGQSLAEIGEMIKAGAVAISDDGNPLNNSLLMRYALEYSQMYNIPVINHAEDINLRSAGQMHEGVLSTRLGMAGIPDISESVMVYRDLSIAEYTGGRLHIPHVSTEKSVELVRLFKGKGVRVTAEVSPHHLGLTDASVRNFDTNAKVAPPLCTEADRRALIAGLQDGTLDCIATDHAPHTIEDKEKDFINAPCGMIGMESAFGMAHTALISAGSTTEDVIKWFTTAPGKIFGLPTKGLTENSAADIAVIDPAKKWVFQRENIFSRSQNTPMVGMEFTGRVVMTVSGGQLYKAFD